MQKIHFFPSKWIKIFLQRCRSPASQFERCFQIFVRDLTMVLTNAYGLPRKTNKVKLLQLLGKGTPVGETYPKNACSIDDGMSILQTFQPPAGATFAVLAERIFNLVARCPSRRVDVVFGIYLNVSTKNAE